jgi:hypothetical protein
MIPPISFIWENSAGVWYIHLPFRTPTPGGKTIADTFSIAINNLWISKWEKARLYNPLTKAFYDLDFESYQDGGVDLKVLTY